MFSNFVQVKHTVKLCLCLSHFIDPSPDWFVGVSGLNLCLPNCSWSENKVVNLFPWDAGTNNGITYSVSLINEQEM